MSGRTPKCGDHRELAGQKCPECGEVVDDYGNTESDFRFCSFPDCGCDGARLCMAGSPSVGAMTLNREKGQRP